MAMVVLMFSPLDILSRLRCEIQWKEGKDPTHVVIKKKQKNKKTGQVRKCFQRSQPFSGFACFRMFFVRGEGLLGVAKALQE